MGRSPCPNKAALNPADSLRGSTHSSRQQTQAPLVIVVVMVVAMVILIAMIVTVAVLVPVAVMIPAVVVFQPAPISIPVPCEVLLTVMVRLDPVGAAVRRPRPVAFMPFIVVAVRIPISADPHIIRTGTLRHHANFARSWRRADIDAKRYLGL